MEKISEEDERTKEWKEEMKDTEEKIVEHEALNARLKQKLEELLDSDPRK